MTEPGGPAGLLLSRDLIFTSKVTGTARELGLLPGHRVVVLWQADADFERAVESVGAALITGRPESREGLEAAGVRDAATILALQSSVGALNGEAPVSTPQRCFWDCLP